MKKKLIALLLGAAMLGTMIGCGSNNTETSTETTEEEAEAEAEADADTDADAAADEKSGTEIAADAVVIKLATSLPTEAYRYEYLEEFKALVEERSNGTMTVELYPSSQLGGQNEVIEGMGMGTIEMTYVSAGAAESFYPESGLMGTLFTARDEDHALKIWESEKGQEIIEGMASEIGVRFLDFSIEGVRSIWSKEPIESLADLEGLKMRVPEVPIFISTFEALGVNPTPMTISEVYTALQTNMIDGLEYNITSLIEQNLQELCKYCYETKHGVSIMTLGVAESFWQGLTEEQREIISTASAEVSEELIAAYYEEVEEARTTLEEQGVTFVTPTEEEAEQISETMEPLIVDYIKDYATAEDLAELKAIE